MPEGSLIVVGVGIRLAQQCTPEARHHIIHADVVYAVCGDPASLHWLERLNPNTISLHQYYRPGRPRDETYEMMTEAILDGVRGGRRVCAAFYGHPGVFVTPSHAAIARARLEGFETQMLPAVSAEDCLYADLGIDPCAMGCVSFEATDFYVHARKVDPTALLILWQIAFVADESLLEFESDPRRVQLLGEVLMEVYPAHHLVTLYEAATLPVSRPIVQTVMLAELHLARVTQQSTLVVPPLSEPTICPERQAKLQARQG
jgi:uncharacterized protein YabN with tetrapyrrole methylase and pyrophosphatase domain